MVIDLQGVARSSVDFKSTQWPMLAILLRDGDMAVLLADLEQHFAQKPGFFDGEPVLLDLQHLPPDAPPLDFAALVQLLRQHQTLPVAVRAGSPEQLSAAQAAGLLVTQEGEQQRSLIREVEVVREVPVEVEVTRQLPPKNTLVVDKPLRSGQQVYGKDCDVVVLAIVSYGAEVIADGSVHVYAPLRGRAVAGASGNTQARIFSTCMQPQLLSIGGVYRALETDLPADIAGKPAQARLEADKLLIEALSLS